LISRAAHRDRNGVKVKPAGCFWFMVYGFCGGYQKERKGKQGKAKESVNESKVPNTIAVDFILRSENSGPLCGCVSLTRISTRLSVCECVCSRKMQPSWKRWHCMRMTDSSVHRLMLCKGSSIPGMFVAMATKAPVTHSTKLLA